MSSGYVRRPTPLLSKWDEFKKIVNSIPVDEEFKRSRLMRSMPAPKAVDTYRWALTQAGYIIVVSRGRYKRVKDVPSGLLLQQVLRDYRKTIVVKDGAGVVP
jgi:hypothetical protein